MTPAEIALLGGPAPWLGKDRIAANTLEASRWSIRHAQIHAV